MDNNLLLLWGKTVKGKPDQYHPLLFHLLDVGYCAELLWDECLSDSVKKRLTKALGLSAADTRRAVILLSALHDIGKATPGFQLQVSAPCFLRAPLKAAGLNGGLEPGKPHGLISTFEIKRWIESGEWVWTAPQETALIAAHIVGAHHGIFPTSEKYDFGKDGNFDDKILGDEAWFVARRDLADAVIELMDDGAPFQSPKLEDAGVVAILSGLIAVADWLGSSYYFPAAGREDLPQGAPPLAQYNVKSKNRAREAMEGFGWLPGVTFAKEILDFGSFFNFAPNSLQKAIVELSTDLKGPFLAIAEAPMGVGKTEASFAALDAALVQSQANGFYIALPTQATGNAMHDRVRDDYLKKGRHTGNLNLQLVHASALLKEEAPALLNSVEIQPGTIEEDGSSQATVTAQSWFTARKQSLLAPFGAGTIDQSLMGVLQTKHWFVRLFGLAGKVVVFDEVHAYDTYMSTLLQRLLWWLRVLDCSVILLSATLPSSKRHALMRAWGVKPCELEATYPRLTWVSGQKVISRPLQAETLQHQNISLSFLPTSTEELTTALRDKLCDGGCAAIICNTVDRAQKVFAALKCELGEDYGEWHLFHARMPFAWRQEREYKILKSFGKTKMYRPYRAIVVATQVIEQSLDLDFDWMATELAPVDLILQRAGRLHRHKLDENKKEIIRPILLHEPELAIICDFERDEPPSLEGCGAIYERFILLCTWLALRHKASIALPGEIESLIEDVYEHKPVAPDTGWQIMLDEAQEEFYERHKTSSRKAKSVIVAAPEDPETVCDGESRDLLDDDDPYAHETLRAATREGDPSLQCVCLVRTPNGIFLPDATGRADTACPINIDMLPNRETTRTLLRLALPISSKRLFFTLREQGAPSSWNDNAHLRYARALEFENGVCQVASHKVRLDGELGIVIEKGDS